MVCKRTEQFGCYTEPRVTFNLLRGVVLYVHFINFGTWPLYVFRGGQ